MTVELFCGTNRRLQYNARPRGGMMSYTLIDDETIMFIYVFILCVRLCVNARIIWYEKWYLLHAVFIKF